MIIFGLGSDVVNTKRFKKILKNNHKFKSRIFTRNEIKFCDKKKENHLCYAKRFAAKEAFSKALGTGFSSNLNFKDIEITNDKKGMPKYVDNKKIIKIVQKKYKIKKFNSFLSISDEKDYSTAFAIIQSI